MIGWLDHRRCPRWIALHFGRALPRGAERRMRRHLTACAGCRDLYDTQLLLEGEGDGAAAEQRDRLARALFDPPTSAAPRRRLVLVGAAAAALLLLAVVVPRLARPPGFVAKGGGEGDGSRFVSVAVYARQRGELERVRRRLAPSQGLAFAYSNGGPRRFDRLLLFAVDERHEVYWYYPAWTDPRANPAAVPVRQGSGIELPDEVRHRYGGSRLRIFALFTRRRDLTVRQVEAAVDRLRRKGVPVVDLERFPLEGTAQHTLPLEVSAP